MKILKTIKDSDFPDYKPLVNVDFKLREAARAVLFDKDNKIALLYVSNFNYHKLPGGGVEENEDIFQALEREVFEETGCKISVTKKIGIIHEYKEQESTFQKSYCYIVPLIHWMIFIPRLFHFSSNILYMLKNEMITNYGKRRLKYLKLRNKEIGTVARINNCKISIIE
jgi:hypothetical protein